MDSRNNGFSRWWLYFKGPLEKEFIADLNRQRALGVLDPLLFALSACSTLASIPRVIKSGHSNELALVILNALFSTLVTYLYRRPGGAGLVRSLRIPLHVFSHISNHILLYRFLGLKEMLACANSRPNTELLCLWWVFQALYPTVASVPLIYAAPMQAFITLSMLWKAPVMCQNGFEVCPAAADHHLMLASCFSVASLIIPSPMGIINIEEIDPMRACMAGLYFMPTAVLLMIFYVVSYRNEAKLRAQ